MIVFLLLIVVLLVGLTTAAVMGRIGGSLVDRTSSQSFGGIPAVGNTSGSLPDEIAHLQFDQALRGYRMDQVDDVINALCRRLRELESQVASASAMGGVRPEAPDLGMDPQE